MADLKLNGITPDGVGKIKLGGSNVQKIYSSSTLVWPTAPGPCTGYEFNSYSELWTAVQLWVSNRAQAIIAYGEINTWCTGNVTETRNLFVNKTTFNDDISNWDMSNVTNMQGMFFNCQAFNQDISGWDVSSAVDMRNMFAFASSFDIDIGSWNVSNVTNMNNMFQDATIFNKNLSGWCVTNITSEPFNFSFNSALTQANKPVWGTCPP
jgi:surface protein